MSAAFPRLRKRLEGSFPARAGRYLLFARRGYRQARALEWNGRDAHPPSPASANPLRDYFDSVATGPGIWKWEHYFEIYHRHFQKFRNTDVHILEIGVYSGGSLGMWREYFGPHCHVHGADIEESCQSYELPGSVTIHIGDQADRGFWQRFKKDVPRVDIIIDDGGHASDQQIVTLEEMLPHLSMGGVYLCEDIHGAGNEFLFYMDGLSHHMHHGQGFSADPEDPQRRSTCVPTELQANVHSVHHYPFLTVIEKRNEKAEEFVSSKRGTEWEPFF